MRRRPSVVTNYTLYILTQALTPCCISLGAPGSREDKSSVAGCNVSVTVSICAQSPITRHVSIPGLWCWWRHQRLPGCAAAMPSTIHAYGASFPAIRVHLSMPGVCLFRSTCDARQYWQRCLTSSLSNFAISTWQPSSAHIDSPPQHRVWEASLHWHL